MPYNNRRKMCEPSPGRNRIVYLFPVLILVLLTSFPVSAQSPSQRPRVGLVLSGGGSLGMAHVGVLKVMEEAGLRPDYITGVSMGSIIGGFYAIGYSADSLHRILNTVDWDLVMSNTIPQNRIIFNEKKHFDNSILSLPFSLRKFKLPSGLISGQQIENTLSYYAWPAADINDFSKLPIPFACVGTDLLTVTKVTLNKGYLPDAMRASSAIPSVFSPIKIDTFLLSDGGFLRNFPAVEVKNMGADIIIGSYTAFQPNTERELQNFTGIVKQIVMSRSIEDFKNQRDLIDFLIMPRLKGLSSLDFNAADSLINRGYQASLPYKEQFKKLADSLNMFCRQTPLPNILNKQFYSFDRIEISGDSVIPERQILGVLDIKPGEPVDKSMLYEKIDLLYGKAWFEKVKYRIESRNDSLILVIDCIEKPRSLFYGSVHYDNALGAGMLVSLSFKNLPTQASVFNLDFYIGQFYRVRNSFSQYINRNQRLGFSIDFYTDNTLIPKLDLRGEIGDVISRNFSTGLSINRMLGLNQMMNISANFENRYLLPRYVSENYLKYLSYDYISAAFNYSINTLDSRHFPDRGSILNIHAGTSGLIYGRIKTGTVRTTYKKDDPGSFLFDRFYTITGSYRQYITKVKRFTFSLRGDVVYVSDCDSVSSHNNFFLLGGQTPLNARSIPVTGFHPNQIPVKRSAGVGMVMDMEILKDVHLSISGNVFAAQEADRTTGYSLLAGYGLEAGYMSIIGPIKAGIMQGFYDRENHFSKIKAYISAGYLF